MNGTKRFDLTFETKQLVDLGKEIKEGETWLYADMTKRLGVEYPEPGHGLPSARRILQRDFGILFVPVVRVGLRRLTNGEKPGIISQAIETAQRLAHRTSKKLGTIDYAQLTDEQKVEANAGMTVVKFMEHTTSRKTYERIKTVVNENKGVLSIGDTMKLFEKK